MQVGKNGFLVLSAAALLVACSSTPLSTPEPKAAVAPVVSTVVEPSVPAKPSPAAQSGVQSVVVPAYLDPKSSLSSNRSVYFDFDVFTVKPEFDALLEVHGKYLAATSKLAIRVEGNADERGSSEYNLALGQKRADAVVRALKIQGVKDEQLEAVSWGKEKPKAAGHDEAAWAQNRRVDLAYPSK